MYKNVALVLDGLELRKTAEKENNLQAVEDINNLMDALIESMKLPEVIELSQELVKMGKMNPEDLKDFGYPQRIITPSPIVEKMGCLSLFFKRK